MSLRRGELTFATPFRFSFMKRIVLTVTPRSSRNEIIEQPDGSLKVKLTSAPVDGEANKKLIEVMSGYFGIGKSRIRIARGERSRKKVIEIVETH